MKTILVIDDDKRLQEMLKLLLEIEGFKVFQAFDLDQAGKVFATHLSKLDVIVVDWTLKNHATTGDLIAEMRESFPKHKPIIAFSANEKSREKQMKAGCTHQFSKNDPGLPEFLKAILK